MTKPEIIRRLRLMADTETGEETVTVDARGYYALLGDLKAEVRVEQQGGVKPEKGDMRR